MSEEIVLQKPRYDTATMSTEDILLQVWQDIFGISDLNVNSDFFELGGNSLTAIKLISQVEKIFGPETLLPEVLFDDGCLKSIAAAIDSERNKRA